MTQKKPDDPGADSLVGQMIYGYLVDGLIGRGSQGDIYRLRHPTLRDKLLALKVLRHEAAMSKEMRSRFWQDALAASKVGLSGGAAGVVQPFQVDELPDGRPYIVMELAPGESLDHVLRDWGPLPIPAALYIASSVAATMAEVHRCGIIHRDLKPANLMVDQLRDEFTTVKLLDFGVARVSSEIRRFKTAAGTVLGTRIYMAPEVALGGAFDGRADVYSLGVVLFEMLSGQVPFEHMRETASLKPAPDVTLVRPGHLEAVPEFVARIVARALAKDVNERYTMAQLRDDLLAAKQRIGSPAHYLRQTIRSVAVPIARPVPPVVEPGPPPPAVEEEPGPPTEVDSSLAPTEILRRVDRLPPPGSAERTTEARPRSLRPLLLVGLAMLVVAIAGGVVAGRMWRRPSRAPGAPPTAAAPAVDASVPADAARPAPPRRPVAEVAPSPTPPSRPRAPEALRWTAAAVDTRRALFDLWSDGKGRVIVVGEAGLVLRSEDNGLHWSRHDLTTRPAATLYGLWGSSDGELWACGDRGTIVHSRDGKEWEAQLSGGVAVLGGIWGSGAGDLYVVSNPAGILRSSDGGKTWSKQRIPSGNGLRRVWGASPRDVWAVGWGETVLHSDGKTWSELRSGPRGNLYDVWGAEGTVFVVGSRRPPGSRGRGPDDLVLVTRDGGRSFAPVDAGTRLPLYAVGGRGLDDVYVVGPSSLVLHSDGKGWRPLDLAGRRAKLGRVQVGPAGDVFLLGLGGLLLHGQ